MGTGPPRARTEVIRVDLGAGAGPSSHAAWGVPQVNNVGMWYKSANFVESVTTGPHTLHHVLHVADTLCEEMVQDEPASGRWVDCTRGVLGSMAADEYICTRVFMWRECPQLSVPPTIVNPLENFAMQVDCLELFNQHLVPLLALCTGCNRNQGHAPP